MNPFNGTITMSCAGHCFQFDVTLITRRTRDKTFNWRLFNNFYHVFLHENITELFDCCNQLSTLLERLRGGSRGGGGFPWNPPFEIAFLTRDTLIEQLNRDTLIEQSQ